MAPEHYDHTRESQILEILAVLLAQTQLLLGNQSGVKVSKLPESFDDLIQKPKHTTRLSESEILAAIADFDEWERVTRGSS